MLGNRLIYASKLKNEKLLQDSFTEENYKKSTPLIKVLHNLQMQVLPFHNFIFRLKVVSVNLLR